MLILSRKPGESLIIDGRITVKVVRLDGDVVKLGIEAPGDVPVHREEVYLEIQRNNQQALSPGRVPLPRLPGKPAGPGRAGMPLSGLSPITLTPASHAR